MILDTTFASSITGSENKSVTMVDHWVLRAENLL